MKRSCLIGVGISLVWACLGISLSEAADETSPSPLGESASSPDFEPGEISIGEPLQVPFRKPDAVVSPPDMPAGSGSPAVELPRVPRRFSAADTPPAALTPEAATAGTGWLGITVDDSLVPGRLVVVEVAHEGPAAVAGIEPQDLLLGINGSPLRTSDEMAAILATISPGMTVKAAVGKGERIEERALVATRRPPPTSSPGWQGSSNTDSVVTTPPAAQPPITQPLPDSPSVAAQAAPAAATPPRNMTPFQAPAALPARSLPASPAPLASASPVGELPAPALSPTASPSARGRTALGVRTVPVDEAVQARYRLPEATGAYVIGVVGDLPASKAGVPPGSVIVAIRNQPVRGPQELTRLVTSSPVGSPVPLQYVLPGGESREAEVVLQSLELPLEQALVGERDAAAPNTNRPRWTERVAAPTIAPATASTPLTLEEEVRLLRRQIERLEQRLERLEPRVLR